VAGTQYRQYKQLNELVSRVEGQICSGIAGREYVVFDQDGGKIAIDLSAAPPERSFAVLWFDPASGREQNGAEVAGGVARSAARTRVLHTLDPGQRKGIQNQRVTLVEGDETQKAIIQRIFHEFVELS